jgi:glycosyltransferase involved in cell wall biosynthesis
MRSYGSPSGVVAEPRDKMRVLQVISSGGYFGAEAMLINLSKSLRKIHCDSLILTFFNEHKPNTDFVQTAEREQLRTRVLRCRARIDIGTVAKIKKTITEENIDVVHTHGYKANVYGLAAAKWAGVPVVVTCHGYTRASAAVRFYSWLDRVLLRFFDQIIPVSARLEHDLAACGVPSNRISRIGNGISIERFVTANPSLLVEARQKGKLIIGTVARLVPEKGIADLLTVIPGILNSFPHVEFLIVGGGPGRCQFENRAAELGIAEHVCFAGQREDMPGVYASMDLFVLPSHYEGLPMSILEAMASGVPVVATAVGDISNVVQDCKTGLIVPPHNPLQLSNAIRRLLDDKELRKQLSANGRDYVAHHFTSDMMAAKYRDVYFGVVANPGFYAPQIV